MLGKVDSIPSLSDEAVSSFIKEIAYRMSDPEKVVELVSLPSNINPSTSQLSWMPLSLSHGYPGLLLLFATLDQCFPEDNWDKISHQYVLKIKEVIEKEGVSDFSIFGGLSGVCFAIEQASRKKTRYQKLLGNLENYLIEGVKKDFFPLLEEKIFLGLPARMDTYDAISGVTGIGSYFLRDKASASGMTFIKKIIELLIGLCRDIRVGGQLVPGWYVPSHFQFLQHDKKIYPKGNFNLGLAHGATGILAFLSICLLNGIELPGQTETIEKIARWLQVNKRVNQWGDYWVDHIAFEKQADHSDSPFIYDAWCYGSAGVVRALYLAGKALDAPEILQTAQSGFNAIENRIQQEMSGLNSPTFCHGYAGLLLMTYLMSRDLNSPSWSQLRDQLLQKLFSFYRETYPFGFKDFEPLFGDQFILNQLDQAKMIEIDKVGVLEGVSGILLSLISCISNKTDWALPFLIEGRINE